MTEFNTIGGTQMSARILAATRDMPRIYSGPTGRQPEHSGIKPPPLTWPETTQFQWRQDFDFYAGEQWGELPLTWYLAQLGDA